MSFPFPFPFPLPPSLPPSLPTSCLQRTVRWPSFLFPFPALHCPNLCTNYGSYRQGSAEGAGASRNYSNG
jgi:hypothetical protein